jgi:hypothetical protein
MRVFEDPLTKRQRLYRVGEIVFGAALSGTRCREVMLNRGVEPGRFLFQQEARKPPARDFIPVPVAAKDPVQLHQAVFSQGSADRISPPDQCFSTKNLPLMSIRMIWIGRPGHATGKTGPRE